LLTLEEAVTDDAKHELDPYTQGASAFPVGATLRLGVFTAEGDPVRVFASPDALGLLDLAPERAGASPALLERTRFEGIARLHREANQNGQRRAFSGTLRILLGDGGERRLLARGVPDLESPEPRSLGILLDITPPAEDDLAALELALERALSALDEEAQNQR
jgi:hypothetical protein